MFFLSNTYCIVIFDKNSCDYYTGLTFTLSYTRNGGTNHKTHSIVMAIRLVIIWWQKESMACLTGGVCTWLSRDGGLRQEHGRGQLRGWRWHGGRSDGPGVAEAAAVLGLVEKTEIELGTGIERDVRVKLFGRRSTTEVRTQGLVDLKDIHVEPSSRRRTWSRTRHRRRSAGTGSKTYGVGAPLHLLHSYSRFLHNIPLFDAFCRQPSLTLRLSPQGHPLVRPCGESSGTTLPIIPFYALLDRMMHRSKCLNVLRTMVHRRIRLL